MGRHTKWVGSNNLLKDTATDLDDLAETLEDLALWAEDEEYVAIQHKLQSAIGLVVAASRAAFQYSDGTLPGVLAPWTRAAKNG